jgi:hypothetical protein
MKIDFNKPFCDLDGNQIGEIQLNKELAKYFAADTHKDSGFSPLDAYDLALKMNRGEVIDLKKGEQELFKTWVEKSETLNVLFKGQVLDIINNSKSE